MTASARAGLDLLHFRGRLLQDALSRATSTYWLRRADTFERARPRPGDYWPPGTPTSVVEDKDRRLAQIAALCRHRASIALIANEDDAVDAFRAITHLGGLPEVEELVVEVLAAGHQRQLDRLDSELLEINRRFLNNLDRLGAGAAA